jgi:hypothetical protein
MPTTSHLALQQPSLNSFQIPSLVNSVCRAISLAATTTTLALSPCSLFPSPRPAWSCRYTWEIYARRLLDLTSVYSFWKHVSNLERSETKRYLEMLYVLRLRPLIEKVREWLGVRGGWLGVAKMEWGQRSGGAHVRAAPEAPR